MSSSTLIMTEIYKELKEENEEKGKKKFNFGKFILFILIICLIYFGIKYLCSIKTKNIIIVNNNYYSDEEIIETAGIEDYPKFITLSRKK